MAVVVWSTEIKKKIVKGWDWLTKPSDKLTDPGQRRRSHLLSIFLIYTALIFLVAITLRCFTNPQYSTFLPQFFIIFMITLLVYWISRSRYYIIAAVLTTSIIPLAVLNAINQQPVFAEIKISLTMLILSLLMSEIFLPAWGTILFSVINLTIIVSLPWVMPDGMLDFYDIFEPLSINLVASLLAIIGLYNQKWITLDRHHDLSQVAEKLKHEVNERIHAEEELRIRATRLELLMEMGHNTTAIMEINELLRITVERLTDTFGFSNVNILLAEGEEIVLRASSLESLRSREGQIRLKIGVEGINGWVAKKGLPLLVSDVTKDDRFFAKIPELQMKSELAVPIKVKNQVIGVLDAQSTQINNFTIDDQYILTAVADQLAIAIDNTRLYKAGQEELEERQQIEAALRISEVRYRAVVEDQTEAINSYSPDGIITFANSAYARLIGKSPDEIIGLHHEDILSNENYQTLKLIQERLNKENPIISSQHRHLLPDGHLIWMEWLDRVILDPEGNPIEYQGVGRDITKQKEAEFGLLTFADNIERYATQLQVAAEIARDAATARDLESLLKRAVDLVTEHFGFYYAGIFLMDVDKNHIILTAASGERGAQLLSQGHQLEVGARGIVGYVANKGQPRIAPDVSKDPFHLKQPLLLETRSEMTVPLKIMNRVIGVFDVQSQDVGAFDGHDLIAFQTMADQLAIAIENMRLVFEAQRRSQELSGLYDAALATSSILDISILLENLYEHIQHLMSPDTFIVALYNSRDETYSIVFAIEHEEPVHEFLDNRYTLSEGGLTGWILENRRPLLVHDIDQDSLPIEPIRGVKPVHGWLGVPLISRSNLIGAISVQSFQPNAFDESHQRFLESLAVQFAVVLENARLFEAERKARRQAETLQEVAQVLGSSLESEQILELILGQLKSMLIYNTASVLLWEKTGSPAFVAVIGYKDHEMVKNQAGSSLKDSRILANMAKDLHPIMIADVRQHPDWIWLPGAGHVRSFMGVPVVIQNKMIGTLMVDSDKVNFFTEEDLLTVQTLARHMAIAIERTNLFKSEEKRAAELEILRQVSLGLTARLESEAVFDSILNGVFELIPNIQDAYIFTFDNENLKFGSSLWQDGRRGFLFSQPRQHGLTYSVARSGETILVEDFGAHPLFSEEASKGNLTGSIVGIPLKISERVVGVLNVAHINPHAFSEVDLRLLRLLADQGALAIENARLFEQTMSERRHISLLYNVSQGLAVSLDLAEILKQALELTCQALAGNVGAVWIYDRDGNCLVLQVLYAREILPTYHLDPDKELRMNIGEGIVGWVAQNNKALNIHDVLQDERWAEIPYLSERVHSMIVSPISDGQNLLGVMTVLQDKAAAFTDDHLDLLQSICQQVGLALSNVRRYEDVNRLVDLLAAEQYRLESLIEMLPVGVLLLDQDDHLLLSNQLGKDLLAAISRQTEDLRITHLGDMTLPDLYKSQDSSIPIEVAIDEPERGIYEAQARKIKGESVQWVLTLRDVTQERGIQERIQMQDRLATVGQLASGIAHDFNNIMAAIVVYTDLLMMEPSLTTTTEERLGVIQQQVQRASSLIRQILDFSRSSIMEQRALNLLPFMKEILKLLQRTLPETIQLNLFYDERDYIILADPTRLQQVFLNLAVNARDAMPEGGKLDFHLEHCHIGDHDKAPPFMNIPPGDYISITVRDTGIGIPLENKSKIFEPFFTTKPVGQGTGLGLAQVYGIVRQHEGFIEVDSQLEVGTCFYIFLPALISHQDFSRDTADLRTVDGTGKTVLLVEDDDSTRTALQAFLAANNFQVLSASNGKEALDILTKKNVEIALVVSDIFMPEMGGMDLYNVMQIRWPGIRMLFITGHPLDSDNQRVLETGNVDWLQKPFSVNEFNQTVRRLMEQ